jgi:hypothetical protein
MNLAQEIKDKHGVNRIYVATDNDQILAELQVNERHSTRSEQMILLDFCALYCGVRSIYWLCLL